MSKNYDYTTGNLFDYLYHQKYYKLIDFDLSRQTITGSSQEINSVGKLEDDNGTTTLFIVVMQKKKNNSKFLVKLNTCNRIIKIMKHQKMLSLLNDTNYSNFCGKIMEHCQ